MAPDCAPRNSGMASDCAPRNSGMANDYVPRNSRMANDSVPRNSGMADDSVPTTSGTAHVNAPDTSKMFDSSAANPTNAEYFVQPWEKRNRYYRNVPLQLPYQDPNKSTASEVPIYKPQRRRLNNPCGATVPSNVNTTAKEVDFEQFECIAQFHIFSVAPLKVKHNFCTVESLIRTPPSNEVNEVERTTETPQPQTSPKYVETRRDTLFNPDICEAGPSHRLHPTKYV